MVKHYFRIAFRNLVKHKGYSFINVSGLALGIASCILIMFYIQDELSYDRHHEKASRTYRVAVHQMRADSEISYAVTPAPLAATLIRDYPEVVHATRIYSINAGVRYETKQFNETDLVFVEPGFFDVFTIPLAQGDPRTALSAPNTAIITEEMAAKYFGDENPIGKTITVVGPEYTITGVAKNVSQNSHFHYNILLSFSTLTGDRNKAWDRFWNYTYLVLGKNVRPEKFEAKIRNVITKYTAAAPSQADRFRCFLQPLTDIHLHSNLSNELEANGDIKYVYLFGIIAAFILLIACINFINLATARSSTRAKEVGLRKVFGSHRKQLIKQFLSESVLLSFIAMLFVIILIEISIPTFNNLTGKNISIDYLGGGFFFLKLFAITLLAGLLAGSYPAFVLSAFKPSVALKGKVVQGVKGGGIRSGLVVLQFAASAILIIGTIVVYNQMEYIQNKKLGFDKENMLGIRGVWFLNEQAEVFRQQLLERSDISSVAAASRFIRDNNRIRSYLPEGSSSDDEVDMVSVEILMRHDLVGTVGMEIVRGRNFSGELASDSTAALINETAAKLLGWGNPLGKRLRRDDKTYTVVGVVRDFHTQSLQEEIAPTVLHFTESVWRANLFHIRFRSDDISGLLAILKQKWEMFVPDQPFSYFFFDERIDSFYVAEQKVKKVIGIFSLMAILIASLGLFGLSSFTARQKTKEIGIRKVLGASAPEIVFMLLKNFLKLVGIAFIIASLFGYIIMNRWLEDFAFHISLGFGTFVIAGTVILIIALISVCSQTVKAALSNPVKSLRYE